MRGIVADDNDGTIVARSKATGPRVGPSSFLGHVGVHELHGASDRWAFCRERLGVLQGEEEGCSRGRTGEVALYGTIVGQAQEMLPIARQKTLAYAIARGGHGLHHRSSFMSKMSESFPW